MRSNIDCILVGPIYCEEDTRPLVSGRFHRLRKTVSCPKRTSNLRTSIKGLASAIVASATEFPIARRKPKPEWRPSLRLRSHFQLNSGSARSHGQVAQHAAPV